MTIYYFKIKETDGEALLIPGHSKSYDIKIQDPRNLINNYKDIMWVDNNGNMILHHLVFLIEKSCPIISQCLKEIVDSVLESIPKETRKKLLNHENNNKKTAFELALDGDLRGLMDKFLVHNVLDMEEERDSVRKGSDLKKREQAPEAVMEDVRVDVLNATPYGCNIGENNNMLSCNNTPNGPAVEVKSNRPSSEVYNLRVRAGNTYNRDCVCCNSR